MAEDPKRSLTLHGDKPAAASAQGLIDRRELAYIAVERTRMPMVITDARQPDHPIVLANQAFLDLSGYSADEVIGQNCRFLQGEATSPVAVGEIRAAIEEQREADVELLNYRKSGGRFWNQLHLSPIRDGWGRLLYYFASQLDVSDRRRVEGLEAAEHRLLREVDHRTLNVLSIVESIVRLSRADDPALYAASVQRRVQALARAHSLLAEQGWADPPLERLIHRQIEPYGVKRVTLEGPDVAVSSELVQPLSLVVHEFVANAATHGALAAPKGDVLVRWATPNQGRVKLQWRERGARAPPAGPPGFGWKMIKLIVERQLQGEIMAARRLKSRFGDSDPTKRCRRRGLRSWTTPNGSRRNARPWRWRCAEKGVTCSP